ncbi:MAG: bifunctional oligoribonuclease/PAP phosphatase NrnA [Candidatus Omnitrophica bacterium]|nr:bifunctional oligoribonuclease/PAP phosphatase NrnA [Candidatus Omnitrophota bacterium]
MGLKKVSGAIRKYNNYVITSHIDTEGDALGSEMAVFHLVKQLGKEAVIANTDEVPDRYKFLKGWDKMVVGDDKRKLKGHDNIIVVDCPTIERCGAIGPVIERSKVKIVIDHHVSNERYGDFNWVDPDASSCGEMIFNLYREMGLNINEDIAVMLYVAILTDTGSFRYECTSPETHRAAGELIKLGVHPPKVAERIYETKEMGDIELLSRALSTIKLTDDKKISYMHVTKEMLDETGMDAERTDGFVNYARSIQGSEISIFFRQDANDARKVYVGFRSKGMANVNMLASKFGGGGHPKASGCVLVGDLDKVMNQVLTTAEEFL